MGDNASGDDAAGVGDRVAPYKKSGDKVRDSKQTLRLPPVSCSDLFAIGR